VALLFAMDVAFIPFYGRSVVADWFLQGVFGLLNFTGPISAIAVLASGRRDVAKQVEGTRDEEGCSDWNVW